jgi:hypothetical protein
MASIEQKLDKYATANALVQTYAERIDQLQAQITSSEERSLNINKLLKLQQSMNDTHEDEIKKLNDCIKKINYSSDIVDLQKRISAIEEANIKAFKSSKMDNPCISVFV